MMAWDRVWPPVVGAAVVALCLYALVLGWLWLKQEGMLFFPIVLPMDYPLARERDVKEVTIDVPGARLSALHLRTEKPRGVVLFLHGNGGNLSGWFVNPALYRRAGFDMLMLDYRGYGKSTGHIESEAQLHADVRAAWEYLEPKYKGKRVVIYGRSLGTALAARLAAELQPALTVLVSPYTSMAALTREYYPWVPTAILRYPLRTEEDIVRIKSPILLVHGGKDALIAPRHSERLQALAPHAGLHRIAEADHNDLQDFEEFTRTISAALVEAGTRPGP